MHESLSHEKQIEVIDDNARKFVVEAVDPTLLGTASAKYRLVSDWLEVSGYRERKLARKEFIKKDGEAVGDGVIEIRDITKEGAGTDRKSAKPKIDESIYESLVAGSVLHVEKWRTEFTYQQNGTSFSLNYDEFANGLHILEVDAPTEEERNAFDPTRFPAEMSEVTGDLRYYGYRIADALRLSGS